MIFLINYIPHTDIPAYTKIAYGLQIISGAHRSWELRKRTPLSLPSSELLSS